MVSMQRKDNAGKHPERDAKTISNSAAINLEAERGECEISDRVILRTKLQARSGRPTSLSRLLSLVDRSLMAGQ